MLLFDTYFKKLPFRKSRLYQYLISLLCPKLFVRFIHGQMSQSALDWNGKRVCFVLSFDVDYSEDVKALPYLVENLNKYDFKASFALVGLWVVKFPDEHKLIVEAGYEILNHSYSHPDNEELNPDGFFNRMTFDEQFEEIRKCDDVIKEILGIQTTGFRTPHFGNLHTEQVYEAIQKLGYRCSTSTVAPFTETFGLPFKVRDNIWEFPVSTCPSHPFSTFDTWHSFRKPGGFFKHGAWHRDVQDFLANFRELVEIGIECGSFINLYFDPRDIMAKNKVLDGIFEILKSYSDRIWFANYTELVNFFSEKKENV